MNTRKNNLQQLTDRTFLTDGGLETVLAFHEGFDLPEFAAFTLFDQEKGYQALRDYYLPYIRIAKEKGTGFILESPTWRASRAWGEKLGYDAHDLARINRTAISMLNDLKREFEGDGTPMVISGCIGPQGDGYDAANALTVSEAKAYHQEQIATLAETEADLVSAFTMTNVEEALGLVLAAKSVNMPVVISFTTETDGKLPSGRPLKEAIEQVDAESGEYPFHYMINCAHPTHFQGVLDSGEPWAKRIRAVRANASKKSHAELDEAEELDTGDAVDLSNWYRKLKDRLPNLNVFGGCCGTDHGHIQQIAAVVR